MPYDLRDTIAAISSAPGGAARGIVRLAGPQAVGCLIRCFSVADGEQPSGKAPRRWPGAVRIRGDANQPPLAVPGHAFVWPGDRSYARQPAVEFHAVGSPPLLAGVLEEFCRCGARPAEPGEFTLRAFLAGRIDLTQAEAVLGVVDARGTGDLNDALDQLAGGLSRPLHELREQLLTVLAELEAGLDFADEPIEFISRAALADRIAEGRRVVTATLVQLHDRDRPGDFPRVALVGPPNAGKSSLFNTLVERYGVDRTVRSLVAPQPGATRDYVTARLDLAGLECELIDAAGADAVTRDKLHQAAQQAAAAQQRRAEVRLHCQPTLSSPPVPSPLWGGLGRGGRQAASSDILVNTKCDLDASASASTGAIPCSSVTGHGLERLAAEIRRRLEERPTAGAAATAVRCTGSLRAADAALAAAADLASRGGDELLAAEIRIALHALGEVVGAVCVNDVLDRVFSQFCIGK